MILKVPLWKAIYLSPETASMLHYDSESLSFDKDLAGKTWIMTDNGLKEYLNYQVKPANDIINKFTEDSLKKIKKSVRI